MRLETWILVLIWLSSILLLWRLVPKKKIREAQIIFVFYQSLMWVYGLTLVQFRLVEYPFREFDQATGLNFTLYFVFYPTYAVLMYLYYPKKRNNVWQAGYMVAGTLLLTFLIWLLGFTEIYKIIDYNLYLSFAAHLVMLYITRRFHRWFRKGLA